MKSEELRCLRIGMIGGGRAAMTLGLGDDSRL